VIDQNSYRKIVLKGIFIIIAFITLSFQAVKAQKEGAIWYFGNQAGLDFNQQFPRPLTDGRLNTREGVATICDKNGNLLFYTDGQTVYNRNHEIMDNGQGLKGDISSTQSSIVVPWPESDKLYCIFTVDQAGTYSNPGDGLKYSIVNMDVNGGLGKVTDLNLTLPGTAGILFTEKITVVKHNDTKSYWIIAHEFGTNRFFEFRLTATGLSFVDPQPVGSIHRFDVIGDRDNRGATGYLKSSPKGDFLASAVELLKSFELFTFDNKTGRIGLLAKLAAGDRTDLQAESGAAYGVEFSPTSNFLYGSTRKGGLIYQWSLEKLDPISIQRSVRIIRERANSLCGALQLAFNGKIYASLGGLPYLGVINSPIQENCNYVELGASLVNNETGVGGRAFFGLPTFLSDFFKSAEFYFENTCFRDKAIFYPSTRIAVSGPPSWTVYEKDGKAIGTFKGDPNNWYGVFTFPHPGDFVVIMTINQYGKDTDFPRDITINPLPELDLKDTTSMCKGSPAHLDAGDGAFFDWREAPNLKTNRYLDVYNPGSYLVKVTHYNGCSASDSTRVVEKPIPVILDTNIVSAACGSSNGSIEVKMEKPANQYKFVWAKFPDSTNSKMANLPGGVYDLQITEISTDCSILERLSISETNAPDVTIEPTIKGTAVKGAVCAGSKITLTARGASRYEWDTPEGKTDQTVEVSPTTTTTYFVTGFSASTGKECKNIGKITITVSPYTLPQLGDSHTGCQGDTIPLHGGAEFFSWEWSTGEKSELVNITQSIEELSVIITDKNGCKFSDTTKINIKPLPIITFEKDITQCEGKPLDLTGGPGETFLWSTNETTEHIQVTESGKYTLTIQTNGCSKTDSTNVTIKPLPKIDLGKDDTFCISDPIKLSGGWGESYYWSTNETTQEILITKSDRYILTISLDKCTNSDTVNLTVKPLPLNNLGNDTTCCKSNPLILKGDNGNADYYEWNGEPKTAELSVKESGTYTLKIGKDGCFSTDEITVTMNDPIKLPITVDLTPITCPGNHDGTLVIGVVDPSNMEYSIDGGLSYFDSPIFQGLPPNQHFQIYVKQQKACWAKYDEEVEFTEPDSIQIKYRLISPSCPTCPDGEINLSVKGGTPPYSVLWSTNETNTDLSNLILGKYLVWVTDASNCHSNALIDLTLDFPPFQIPNAFTPNGDNFNEKWEINSLKDFPSCEVKVFDRSGNLVYFSVQGYTDPWDGRDFTKKILPMGAYYYLIWLQPGIKPIKGSVSILR
jgi:gliding motility-associated-like protein